MTENKKIAINSIIIFVRLCVTSVVGLLASRLVLDALGASDYGLYNVVGGIVVALNVFNTAMLSTTYRYIAFEIGKGSSGQPNKVFNVSQTIHFCFALLIILLGATVGEWYINNYLNIAPDSLGDAKFIFRVSIATTAISTILIPYQGLLVAQEKFNVTASAEILAQVFKLLAVILILRLFSDKVRVYSLIMFTYVVLQSSIYLVYCLKHYHHIIALRFIKEKTLYKEMLSFASWTLFGAAANVGKIQGSALVVNYFFGTVVNAAYAVAVQLENFILMFARSLNNAAIPQITKSFSGNNQERSITLTAYISKYTFILMSLVAFPVMLEMEFLLDLWLNEVPEGSVTFCNLMVLTGLLGCLGEGIPALINASGRIKAYQIVIHTILLLGLPIGFIAYKLGCDYYAISVVYCVISGVSGFLKLYMLRRVVEFDVKEFFAISYNRIFYISIPLILFYVLYKSITFSFYGHLIGIVFAECFLIFVILMCGLDLRERKIIKDKMILIKSKLIK